MSGQIDYKITMKPQCIPQISAPLPPVEVVRSGLRVDLNVLCDLAERLSGLFILAQANSRRAGVLHNVTLPRSWFINLILPGVVLRKDTLALPKFTSTMIELM